MFWSGSTRPDQPTMYISNWPAAALVRDVVNSTGCRDTAKPAGAAIDWMIDPICWSSGSFAIMSETWIGVLSPVAATSCFALATFCAGQGTLTAHGLPDGMGEQLGAKSPSKATLFS